MIDADYSDEWAQDCETWRGRLLDPDGPYAHWCDDWDGLPVDETTHEISCCHCYPDMPQSIRDAASAAFNAECPEEP